MSVSDSIANATEEIIEKFNKTPTEVKIDMDKIKGDIIKTLSTALDKGLKDGFKDTNYKFQIKVDSTKLADIMASAETTQRQKFQLD